MFSIRDLASAMWRGGGGDSHLRRIGSGGDFQTPHFRQCQSSGRYPGGFRTPEEGIDLQSHHPPASATDGFSRPTSPPRITPRSVGTPFVTCSIHTVYTLIIHCKLPARYQSARAGGSRKETACLRKKRKKREKSASPPTRALSISSPAGRRTRASPPPGCAPTSVWVRARKLDRPDAGFLRR